MLLNDYKHLWSVESGTYVWHPLYQGKIFEQEGVCRDSSTSLHIDRANENLGINIYPGTSGNTDVLSSPWSDACSKINAGQCSWFHTGQDLSWLGLQNGEREVCSSVYDPSRGLYGCIKGYYSTDPGGPTPYGSYQWPDLQDFAYRVCKDISSSSNCHTNGDLELSKICSSRSIGDVDYSLVNDDFRHRFSEAQGTGNWPLLYQGSISSAAVWSRKEATSYTSSGGTLVALNGGVIGNIDNNGEICTSQVVSLKCLILTLIPTR